MSMVVTSFARDYDSFTYFFSLVVAPMSLLAGTYFPLDRFPKWAQTAAWIMPLTHGVAITRELFLGRWHNMLWVNFVVLASMSVLFFNWAVNQIRRRLIY
jgi:lipooligosaccharide transport system permease protein